MDGFYSNLNKQFIGAINTNREIQNMYILSHKYYTLHVYASIRNTVCTGAAAPYDNQGVMVVATIHLIKEEIKIFGEWDATAKLCFMELFKRNILINKIFLFTIYTINVLQANVIMN